MPDPPSIGGIPWLAGCRRPHGGAGWRRGRTTITDWAESKRQFLLKVLDLPDGIPSKDVFRRVLISLNLPPSRSALPTGYGRRTPRPRRRPVWERQVMAVDGKTAR